ncbi:hypothetical protein HYT02_00170 [Candidatus Gottesmanbacteria bacterium]|nr:hypothetical protein [Candidatus Gottesmanbacteria bacterium]
MKRILPILIIIAAVISTKLAFAQNPTCGLPPVPTWTGSGITRTRDVASNQDMIDLDWNDISGVTYKVSYSIDGGNSFTTAVDNHPTSSLINVIRIPTTASILVYVQSRPTAPNCPLISAPLQGTSDPIPNAAPDCTGGITIQGKQPGIDGVYTINQGETVLLIANGITDPDGDVVNEIKNVLFRYKSTATLPANQCPTSGDGSDLGNGTRTLLSGNYVWSLVFNSTGKTAGDYYFWANPNDIGNLYCSGNPFASSANNYCGAPATCTDCMASVIIRVVPTNTQVPPTATLVPTSTDPCPRGNLGNLNCDPKGCINNLDVDIFKKYFGRDLTTFNPLPGESTPNLFNDDNNETFLVNTADFEILRQNYNNSCQ